jgi:2-amino-4-hydroxy-6-hydroxymethyldihydropteridine diphosphokinase
MTLAYLGLGANVGERVKSLAHALDALRADPRVVLRSVSPAYETEPWGVRDQPPLVHAAAALDFDGDPEELLRLCKEIEARLGRIAAPERYGPRAIDLDVLLFGDVVLQGPSLTLPHPRMAEREFVLAPLRDLEPPPRLPESAGEADPHSGGGRVLRRLGPIPRYEPLTPAVRHRSADSDDRPSGTL